MSALDFLSAGLELLQEQGLFRDPEIARVANSNCLNASSNDYLGLAQATVSRETSPSVGSTLGAGASPLIWGRNSRHDELENAAARWVHAESALLFSSGYAANIGAIAALAGPGDLIISDELNHASIVDGCRLSRAEIRIVPHCNLDAVESALRRSDTRRRWVVTESYFSMDGDTPDLVRLRALCDAAGAALYVDEAHALGVLGPAGAGVCHALKVRPDVLIGTLGKAVGAQGAFVAGSMLLRTWLWNRARSFIFSTAPSPWLTELTLQNLERARNAETQRERIHASAQQVCRELCARGISLPPSHYGHIIPIVVGAASRALTMAEQLRRAGILIQAIRPPTVPKGAARLRVTISASMTNSDLQRLVHELACALQANPP